MIHKMETTANPDYQKLWLQTLLFKKTPLIEVLQCTNKELLNYRVISTNLCFTLIYTDTAYQIIGINGSKKFALYKDALEYMWLTASASASTISK
jgi:hypothetical protein